MLSTVGSTNVATSQFAGKLQTKSPTGAEDYRVVSFAVGSLRHERIEDPGFWAIYYERSGSAERIVGNCTSHLFWRFSVVMFLLRSYRPTHRSDQALHPRVF